MTPLAHKIALDSLRPARNRLFVPLENQPQDVHAHIVGAHCFELTEIRETVWDMVGDLGVKQTTEGWIFPVDDALAFMPAQFTWLEWRDPNSFPLGGRMGILFESFEGEGERFAIGTVCADFVQEREHPDGEKQRGQGFGALGMVALALGGDNRKSGPAGRIRIPPSENRTESTRANCVRLTCFSLMALAFINTPKVIGRRQHMPNVGLERKIARSLGRVGRFPLQAWTEIKLEVGATHDLTEAGEHEAHLTGKRAMHFCRQHLRLRMGRLERVKAHWRGDPALGIKQGRYKVTPSAVR